MGAAVGAAVTVFFTSSAVIYVVARTILINLALGAITKSLTRRKDTPPPLNVTIRGTIERRRIVFGSRRVGGVIVFYGTSDASNTVLWYVIVYTGHQVSAITDVWIDTVKIANADINGAGLVTTGQFANSVRIFKKLGTGAQTVETNIDTAFSEWTTNHRLRGCAYIVVQMNRSDSAFPNGAPQSVSVMMDGALLYDPRKDTTNGGSGTHRRTDPSTWEFGSIGRNPALQARWFISGGSVVNDQSSRMIMYGLREIDARILDSYTITAANECEESISGANAPPSGAQLRYRSDLESSCGEQRRDILEAVLATMAGTVIYEKGVWRIYAGAYDTPVHTLTQDDLYGDLEVQDTTTHEARYNAVGATFVDAAKQYVEQTTILWTDSSYETQDGGERIPRVIDLRGVTDQYQAQRLAKIEHRKSRMMRTVKLPGALNLLKVGKWETINLTHDRYTWSSRIFRTMARQFEFNEEAGRVVLTCQREDPAVYTDPLTADYTTGSTATDAFVVDGPDAPTDLTIERFREQLLLRWTMPTFRSATLYTEVWRYTAQTPFASATKIYESQGNSALIQEFTREPSYFWIRFRNAAGQVSATFPATNGQLAQPLDGLEEEFFDGFEHQDYARFYNLRAGTPTVTYPASGEFGGHVIRVQNLGWIAWKQNIPYDSEAIYVMTVRARMQTASSGGTNDAFYAGVEGVAADGTTLIDTTGGTSFGAQHYFAASAFDLGAGAATGTWQVFRGFLGGFSAAPGSGPEPNITSPMAAYSSGATVVRFIRPLLVMNYNGGNGIAEVDYILLEKVVDTSGLVPNAATDNVSVENAADTNLALAFGGAYGGVGSATFIVPANELWRLSVEYQCWALIGVAGGIAGNFRVLVNGTPIQEVRTFDDSMASQEHQFSWSYVASFGSGTHVFSIEGRATSGTATKKHSVVKITGLKR